jgi:hypothetical protein
MNVCNYYHDASAVFVSSILAYNIFVSTSEFDLGVLSIGASLNPDLPVVNMEGNRYPFGIDIWKGKRLRAYGDITFSTTENYTENTLELKVML